MAGYSYDSTADSYSFGVCLVAMIRGEKDVMEFYFQALRKTMRRKTKKGVGIAILNNRMYSQGWRPLLPLEFKRSFPKMCALIERCWSQKKEDRPKFDEIVRVMQGEVAEEVRRKAEPEIVVYNLEDDKLYHERMGVDEYFEEEEEAALGDTTTMIRKKKHEELLKELKEKVREQARELETLKAVEPTKAAEKALIDTTAKCRPSTPTNTAAFKFPVILMDEVKRWGGEGEHLVDWES